MKDIKEALEYYENQEPHLKAQIIEPLDRMNEISTYSVGQFGEDYREEFNERTAPLRENIDAYTTTYLKEEYDKVIEELDKKYYDKLNELEREKVDALQSVTQLVNESKAVYETNNQVDNGQMNVLQNQLKSEFGGLYGDDKTMASQLLEHFKEAVNRSKHDKSYGRTLATLTYMYDEKFNQLSDEADNSAIMFMYRNLKSDLQSAIHSDRYKADTLLHKHLKRAYGSGRVTNVALELSQSAVRKNSSEFITKISKERQQAQRLNAF